MVDVVCMVKTINKRRKSGMSSILCHNLTALGRLSYSALEKLVIEQSNAIGLSSLCLYDSSEIKFGVHS